MKPNLAVVETDLDAFYDRAIEMEKALHNHFFGERKFQIPPFYLDLDKRNEDGLFTIYVNVTPSVLGAKNHENTGDLVLAAIKNLGFQDVAGSFSIVEEIPLLDEADLARDEYRTKVRAAVNASITEALGSVGARSFVCGVSAKVGEGHDYGYVNIRSRAAFDKVRSGNVGAKVDTFGAVETEIPFALPDGRKTSMRLRVFPH